MKTPLRVLHIEDSEEDSILIQRLLTREGLPCEVIRVEKRSQVFDALENDSFDLILSDCKLPQFSGMHAFEIAHALKPEIPFIFVSGTIGEEAAIESLRNGATDYVLKDRLSRLGPAVRRALSETEERTLCRQLQQRLHESERLEAVCTLSHGIAHDFNNILTIILGHASLLAAEHNQPKRVLEITNVITQAARRASDVVEQLFAFAHKSNSRVMLIDLNRCVEETLGLMRPGLPSPIDLTFQPSHDLPHILADPHQLERMVINLVSNAIDSMPEGGRVVLSTRQIPTREAARDAPSPGASQEYACLQITDTGLGIDSTTRQHIFEPFYTTKERSRGTGLGLPVVYGFMQAHHGKIEVDSEPEKGTTISLFFPLPQHESVQKPTNPRPADPALAGNATVLVIEDENDIANFLEAILQSHGYHVLLAHNAEEALIQFKTNKEEIQVLLSDISLPKMDGITLCSQLKSFKPQLKIIMSSGFSPKEFKTRFEELGIEAFIPKPYNPRDILWNMRKILDGAQVSHAA
jgi:signal transduction histidine kinase